MEAKDVLSLCIATVALIVSLVSIVLQYTVTVDAQFKVTSASFVSLHSQDAKKRQSAAVLNLALYNIGNRPFALDSLELYVEDGNFQSLISSPPNECHGKGKFLQPISKATFSRISVPPDVIPKESIHSSEYVFSLFGADEDKLPAKIEGILCLRVVASDFRGRTAIWDKPIGVMSVEIVDVNNLVVNWRMDLYGREGKLEQLVLK